MTDTPERIVTRHYSNGIINARPLPDGFSYGRGNECAEAEYIREDLTRTVKPLVWERSKGNLKGQYVWSYDDNHTLWIVKNPDGPEYILCENISMEFAPMAPGLSVHMCLADAQLEGFRVHSDRILSALEDI
jgi:hypothetical protein